MTEEQNAPADDAEGDGLALDERAKLEIERERAAAAAAPTGAVENLQRLGADAQTSEEQLAKDDLNARLATSSYGKGLSSRQVEHGTQQILAWESAHGMQQSERMSNWIGNDADRLGYVMRKAAEGELSAPPSDGELNQVASQIAARKELDQIYKDHPPGTPGHTERMARIQMLWQIESGAQALVGHALRRVENHENKNLPHARNPWPWSAMFAVGANDIGPVGRGDRRLSHREICQLWLKAF